MCCDNEVNIQLTLVIINSSSYATQTYSAIIQPTDHISVALVNLLVPNTSLEALHIITNQNIENLGDNQMYTTW